MSHEQEPHSTTRVLLVRHGQSHASVKKLIAGVRTCPGLTEQGREQAARLAARLTAEPARPHALLTSPVRRARETAEILADGLGSGTPVVEPEARELDFGAADGLSIAEYERVHGAFDMTAYPDRPFAPGGETWNRFRTRAGRVVDGLLSRHRGQTVLVVCHAGFIVAAMSALVDALPPVLFTDSTPAATSVNEFVHDGSGWRLARFDDARHLEPAV
ncbi:histidine phosphatase family protein [Streptomyces roseirectus]|uniref:Histidine phosphatase family protein n=1 Tax=Streptomyces roseirectus TaxID=2768066 RepID=A0A7H0I603_9ACTN|nr:histidine phosphatase family protein [Streptomyces roseirectus]QNP68219.1 histidine phosphatase family protein [Streptomyces roseirectus]